MSVSPTEAEALFVKRLPAGAFCHRLVDTKAARNIVNNQPSDFLVVYQGGMWLAEVKLCNNATSFPFDNISTSQKSAAAHVTRQQGNYIFHILNGSNIQWYDVPAKAIITAILDGRKSLKWEELEIYRVRETTCL